MRLLRLEDDGEFSLAEFVGRNIPHYAILSHTWGADDEEVTFKDLMNGAGKSKYGYRKIRFCGNQAAKDGLQFFWVDTCCIDKSNSVELQEAINSMFRWYRGAKRCYVYLPDVSVSGPVGDNEFSWGWKPAFKKSRWFTRGWTLQELIAPTSVEFFSNEEQRLGDKQSLEQKLIDERIFWAAKRETKREEDEAYSLLGIFDIHMPLIYGEGRENAYIRLLKEISESLKDVLPAMPLMVSSKYEDSPQIPSSNIPFPHHPDYVDVQSLLDQIRETLSVPVGLAGVRKSRLQLTSLSGYFNGGVERYCAVWEENQSPTIHIYGLNMAELQSIFDDITAKGYCAHQITSYAYPNGSPRFCGIFRILDDWHPWCSLTFCSESAFERKHAELEAHGFTCTFLNVASRGGGQVLFTAIWEEVGDAYNTITKHSLNRQELHIAFHEHCWDKQTKQPLGYCDESGVCAYEGKDGVLKFAAVFSNQAMKNGTRREFWSKILLTRTELEEEAEKGINTGFALTSISPVLYEGQELFNCTWHHRGEAAARRARWAVGVDRRELQRLCEDAERRE